MNRYPTDEVTSTPTTGENGGNCDPGEPCRCGLALNRGNKGNHEGSPQETICAVTSGFSRGADLSFAFIFSY